jgi:hypothetical protein
MKRSMTLGRRTGKWVTTLLCAAMIAPLTGCALLTGPFLGFTAINALFLSFVGYLPLRALIGTGIRDVIVSIF